MTGLISCSDSLNFKSSSTLAVSLQDMSWHAPVYLEPQPDSSNIGAYTDKATTRGFDIASNGKQITLGASFYDEARRYYSGYIRKFDTNGWAPMGAGFQRVALSGTLSMGEVAVIAQTPVSATQTASGSQSGSMMLALFAESTTAKVYTSFYNGAWQTAQLATLDVPFRFDSQLYSYFGNRISGSFDSYGRAFFIGSNDWRGASNLGYGLGHEIEAWEQVSGMITSFTGGSSPVLSGTSSNGTAIHAAKSIFDGKRYLCFLSEAADPYDDVIRRLNSNCLDIANTTGGTLSITPALSVTDTTPMLSVSGYNSNGMDAATNNDGVVKAVFFQSLPNISGAPLVSRTLTDGVWSDTLSLISSITEVGFQAGRVVAAIPAAAPQIVYLGDNKYLTVWAETNELSTPCTARLMYSIFNPVDETWSTPKTLTADTAYINRQPFESFSLFGNGRGDAAIAVSMIATESETDRYKDVRKVLVARYQVLEGWLPSQTFGNGCQPADADHVAYCTRRPQGAILDSGETTVVFQDQDGSGYYRLRSVSFY